MDGISAGGLSGWGDVALSSTGDPEDYSTQNNGELSAGAKPFIPQVKHSYASQILALMG
jgi:hypothetical protein